MAKREVPTRSPDPPTLTASPMSMTSPCSPCRVPECCGGWEGALETAAPHSSDSIPALACQAGAGASRPARGLRLPVPPPGRADSLAARAIAAYPPSDAVASASQYHKKREPRRLPCPSHRTFTIPSKVDRLPDKNAVCFSYPSMLEFMLLPFCSVSVVESRALTF
jgi:hypothetical protein